MGQGGSKRIDNKDLLINGTLFTHFIHFSDLRSLFQTHFGEFKSRF